MAWFNRKSKKRLANQSVRQGVALVTNYDPTGHVSEEYRTLRTNISFSKAGGSIKTIGVTSDAPAEGKSTVSANLAVTFAAQGLKTILVDLDMRRPTVHATFGLQNTSGLVTLLTNDADDLAGMLSLYCKDTDIDNLAVMTSGPTPPNPSELLGSDQMLALLKELGQRYERIILDTPPLMSVTDAQIVASHADATILVVPYGIAQKAAVLDAKVLLQKVNANIIGVVMNRVPQQTGSGYYYYGGYYK
ncbi:CpsD/CapB family tyrosine-protein kinase [Lacticaseibacillus hegangensis]|uniref:CpsD/CapB family tyrosine-protein kinase n=1 Tax=Lacticaseibacillus hegangensis TaxID=2486010 RepID=A0ABW4CW34_9LACO|nr:CpsD/CapB family tyrosine-protein kinase [Lacticaseibacillus hegangensis]